MSKLKILAGTITILLITFYGTPVFAKDSTASATSTASPSATLQAKLKALQEEIASKAAQLKQTVSKDLQNKAYIGLFNPVSTSSFKILTTNTTKTVNINEFTQYLSSLKTTKGKVDFKSFSASDSVAALGDIDDNGVLTAKKVIKLPPLQLKEKLLILGSVTEINNKMLAIEDKQGKISQINLTPQTGYSQGKNAVTLKNIQANQNVVVIVDKTESSLSARLVYLNPPANIFKLRPASPSAAASPSARPKK